MDDSETQLHISDAFKVNDAVLVPALVVYTRCRSQYPVQRPPSVHRFPLRVHLASPRASQGTIRQTFEKGKQRATVVQALEFLDASLSSASRRLHHFPSLIATFLPRASLLTCEIGRTKPLQGHHAP